MIESLSSASGDLSEQVAQRLLDLYGQDPLACARHTLILPTRRACKSIHDAIAKLSKNQTVFLPQMVALYDIEPLSIKIPEVVPELERQMTLMQLCLKMRSMPYDKAFQLAKSLCGLLDEMTLYEVEFSSLEEIVPDPYARHWQQTLDFLKIISQHWPAILGDRIDITQKRVLCLNAYAKQLTEQPPADPIWAIGLTGGIPAVDRLLQVLYTLPNATLFLTDFDNLLTEKDWALVDETHPQYAYKKLLETLKVEPQNVQAENTPRMRLIHEVMRPALATDQWKYIQPFTKQDISHIRLLELENDNQEAEAVALELRKTLETPDKTAILVTPNRTLARRVITCARRWGIELNDSAGLPLSQTPVGVYLRLLLQDGQSQSNLLALCKHPLATGGFSQATFRKKVHNTEMDWRMGNIFATLPIPDETMRLMKLYTDNAPVTLTTWLDLHIKAAEALAVSDDRTAAERLWNKEEGIEIAQLMNDLKGIANISITGAEYADFFTALLKQNNHRTDYGTHPRLKILGLVEARLQTADTVIVAGLNEGTFPTVANTGPWLSRPMRQKCGLPSPEEEIGMMALDFTHLFLAPEVVLTHALKQDNSQPLASRWLFRLKAVLEISGLDCTEPYTADLDKPQHKLPSAPAPSPCPPLEARPHHLSVTELDTLRKNPYNIYAKHILKLRSLKDLDDPSTAAQYGTAIHKALKNWYTLPSTQRTETALRKYIQQAFDADGLTEEQLIIRRPRLEKVIKWILAHHDPSLTSVPETEGLMSWETSEKRNFTLTTCIDRADRDTQNTLSVLDYKTGSCPSENKLKEGEAEKTWQLPLEAAIITAGGVPEVSPAPIKALSYWHIDGKNTGGEEITVSISDAPNLIDNVLTKTKDLINTYETSPYEVLDTDTSYNDYAYLARILEWTIPTGSDNDTTDND